MRSDIMREGVDLKYGFYQVCERDIDTLALSKCSRFLRQSTFETLKRRCESFFQSVNYIETLTKKLIYLCFLKARKKKYFSTFTVFSTLRCTDDYLYTCKFHSLYTEYYCFVLYKSAQMLILPLLHSRMPSRRCFVHEDVVFVLFEL